MQHVFREANFRADALARRGLSQDKDFVVFETPHSYVINSFVISDNNGLYYSRLTTATWPFWLVNV